MANGVCAVRASGGARARLRRGAALTVALLLAVACGSKRAPAGPVVIVTQSGSSTPASTVSATAGGSDTPRAGPGPAQRTASAAGGFAPGGLPVRTPGVQTERCVDAVFAGLSDEQRAGQLFMVGLSSAAPQSAATEAAIVDQHAGNVVLYGTDWQGAAKVQQTTAWLQGLATPANTGGIGLFISGNQEGGQQGSLQAFYGAGFDPIPTAQQQGQWPPATLRMEAGSWGAQLLHAGVNLNLAPVLDTVDRANAAANAPIGALQREYGFTPQAVATAGVAFIEGMHHAGEAVAVKHFPGLGRVTGNTDFTAQGITDSETAANDPYLQPYGAGIGASADLVMVSLATYTRIDPGVPAVFSHRIVTDLLRSQLGFQGVIVSDDLGAAAAVAAYAPADRALRFFRAGGDMVLTIQPADIAQMTQAVLNQMQSDPKFKQAIERSVYRVLVAKQQAALLPSCANTLADAPFWQGHPISSPSDALHPVPCHLSPVPYHLKRGNRHAHRSQRSFRPGTQRGADHAGRGSLPRPGGEGAERRGARAAGEVRGGRAQRLAQAHLRPGSGRHRGRGDRGDGGRRGARARRRRGRDSGGREALARRHAEHGDGPPRDRPARQHRDPGRVARPLRPVRARGPSAGRGASRWWTC